jgi:hypothetical protein
MSNPIGNGRDQPLEQMLASLPRDVEPEHDLWPGIKARLEPIAANSAQPARGRAGRPPIRGWLWQMAAGIVLIAASSLLTASLLRRDESNAVATSPLQIAFDVSTMPAAFGPADALDEEYEAARFELATMLEQRIHSMPPSAVQKLEANLAEMRRATREINAALELQPGDPLLEELLLSAYQAELNVLANASQLTDIDGAVAPTDMRRTRL